MTEDARAKHRPIAEENDGFPWIYQFGGGGDVPLLKRSADLRLDQPGDGFLWVHLDLADVRARTWLQRQDLIPEAARAMLVRPGEPQHLEEVAGYVSGVIFDHVREITGVSETLSDLRILVGDRLVLSARRRPLQSTDAVRREIEAGRRFAEPAALFEAIVAKIVDPLTSAAHAHVNTLNEIEERVLDDEFHDERNKLGPIRRSAARLHRRLAALRSAFQRFESDGRAAPSEAMRAAMARAVRRFDSVNEELHAIQERARLLAEEMSAQLATETNRNLSLLTGVTTLLLPPTFITGMFGMNVKGLLFGDDENGFFYALGICVVSSFAVYLVMRRLGILR